MPGLALVGAAAGGGRITAPKPTFVHGSGVGVFTISNYDPAASYRVSVTAGTANRVGNTITVSDAGAVCSVYSVKGKNTSEVTDVTWSAYTYHQEWQQTGWNYWWPPPYDGAESCGTWSNGDPWCRAPVYGWVSVKDAPPAGYADSGYEYWKAT